MIDRRVHAITFVVSTGIYRGAPAAAWHRRGWRSAWLSAAGGQLFFMLMAGIRWLLYNRNAATPELRLIAGLMAFSSFVGTIGWQEPWASSGNMVVSRWWCAKPKQTDARSATLWLGTVRLPG